MQLFKILIKLPYLVSTVTSVYTVSRNFGYHLISSNTGNCRFYGILFKITIGKIFIDNEDVSTQTEHLRAKQIGRVFQDPMMGTTSDMRIYKNLALTNKKGDKLGLKWCISKNKIKKYGKIVSPLDLGLENRLNTKVGLLSGGQR